MVENQENNKADPSAKSPKQETQLDFEERLKDFEFKSEAKLAAFQENFKKELELQANKIHSSYAKKLKKLNVDLDAPEDETQEASTGRKPTKRELELQDSVEQLIKRGEEADKRARLATLKGDMTEKLVKYGINPEAVDTIFTVLTAKNAIVDDGELGFKLRVTVDDVSVALPLDKAIPHYVKSQEAKFYLAPKGASGSGSTPPNPTNGTNGKPKPIVEVDWAKVGKDLVHGANGGNL